MTEEMDAEDVKRILRGEHVPRKPTKRPTPVALTITIPIPPNATRPNAGGNNIHVKAIAKKRQRSDAHLAAIAELNRLNVRAPLWTKAEVKATFYRPHVNSRKTDDDNAVAWLKASFDGLQDAGIIANDSGFTHLPPVQLLGEEAGGERKVVLTITRVE